MSRKRRKRRECLDLYKAVEIRRSRELTAEESLLLLVGLAFGSNLDNIRTLDPATHVFHAEAVEAVEAAERILREKVS